MPVTIQLHAQPTYTAGELSRVFNVAHRTVCSWIDTGKLSGYRLPGTGRDRRVTHAALVAFIREHGMPESMIPVDADEAAHAKEAAVG